MAWLYSFGYLQLFLVVVAFACPFGAFAATTKSRVSLKSAQWVVINDTVMGGRSKATLSWNRKSELVWKGQLSLENNGGFVSMRTQNQWMDWSRYDGLEVVLAGFGREIQITAQRRDRIIRAGGYRALVPTNAQGDTKVFIPFSAFVLKRFGRAIWGPSLASNVREIGELGLLIADKREGNFKVVLKSIQPARYTPSKRIQRGVGAALTEAIQQGVPLFNSGDARGCELVYRETLRRLLRKNQLGTGTWAKRLAESALAKALHENPTQAAWTLRRAMDGILRCLDQN